MEIDKTPLSNPDNHFENQDTVKPNPYPDLWQSWGIFGFFLVFNLAISILILPLTSPESFSSIKEWLNLFSYLATFALLFYYIKLKTRGLNQTIKLDLQKVSITVFLFSLFIVQLMTIVLEPLVEGVPVPEFIREILDEVVNPNIASFLTVVIAAPLCEEILCRGIILKGLLKNNMHPTHAIIWSSVIFAALHLNLIQGIYAFSIGCFMGWLYYKTKSIWAAIFVHFINNGTAFLLLLIFSDQNLTMKQLVGDSRYAIVYYLAFILLIVLFWLLYRYFKNTDTEKSEKITFNP